MTREGKELYEFGEFRLDVTERVLVRSGDGQRIPLSEKSFETLCILVRNSGHLLHKETILNQVWADSFVEENNLDKCIYAIRRALGEKPGEQKFIETVRKHGYRFVADVRRVKAENSHHENTSPASGSRSAPSQKTTYFVNPPEKNTSGAVVALADRRRDEPEEPAEESSAESSDQDFAKTAASLKLAPATAIGQHKSRSNYRMRVGVAALIVFLTGAIALGYYFFSAKNIPANKDSKKSIAVLPLMPINAANRNEVYEMGIADSLIIRLNSTNSFVVRPLSATRKYADINQDALAAGHEQQVDYVLASNYQLADGKIKITAQLFNVTDGSIADTYRVEKDAVNLFAMQDAIADTVGNRIIKRFAAATRNPTAKRGTNNEEAYRLYLQAMYLYDTRYKSNAMKAIEALNRALQLDPNYAQGWAGLAHNHRVLANGGRNINIREHYQKSLEAINKALALDGNLSEAHSAACENKMYYEYDFDGAERSCLRAIELDPNSPLAHQVYSRFLNTRGRFEESIAETKAAIDLEPTSLFNQFLYATSFYYARRFNEAVAEFKRVIVMDENYGNAYPWLYTALSFQGKEAEAFAWFMKTQERRKEKAETLQAYQAAFQTSGWQGVMRERSKRFEDSDEGYWVGAGFNAQAGNMDKAFEYLEKSFERREWCMAYLQVDPRFDALREDPRFADLVGRVEFK